MSEKRLDFISAYEKIVYDLRKESEKLIQKHCISCELVNLQTREIDKLKKENEQLRKAEKINMEYAEQIVEENQKLRIAKNNLRRENEQLSVIRRDEIKYWKNKYDNAVETFDVDETTATKIRELEKENEQLKQENNFLKQIREVFQIDVKNSRQMLKGRDSDE